MSELASRIRDVLRCGYEGEFCPAVHAVSDVLDLCDRIEVDLWGKRYWPGHYIANEFRVSIATALGVSTTDSPEGDAGVQSLSGDTTGGAA